MFRVTLLAIVGVIALFALVMSSAAPVYATTQPTATFSGNSTIHVVLKVNSTGRVVNMTIPSTFSVTTTAGGSSVGTLALTLTFSVNGMQIMMKADNGASDPIGTGLISVTSNSATGGGTLLNPASGYMSQFGFGITESGGGQFQCQNTGRSGSVMDGPMSMLLGMNVTVLQMFVHGVVQAGNLSVSN